ncbi:winged helix-turn-helix domain-containing protein [Streptomyces vinaceus]|uniref:helix-turn-helix domain-containing protein n=1 Tax=Streptomyces vinaceus TaxID=1960 RepID=UPI0035D9A552
MARARSGRGPLEGITRPAKPERGEWYVLKGGWSVARWPTVGRISGGRWPRVKTLIGRLFHVIYTVEGTWRLLKRHGWSWQQLARRAIERDDAAVELWKKEVWPRVKHRSGSRGPARPSRTRRAVAETAARQHLERLRRDSGDPCSCPGLRQDLDVRDDVLQGASGPGCSTASTSTGAERASPSASPGGTIRNLAAPNPDQLARTVKRSLKQVQYRPDLIDGCLAGTGLTIDN